MPRPRVEVIDKEIGQRLREFRVASGMTQQQLATSIGVSSVQIQKYEHGENRIAVATLVHICEALHSSPMDFLSPYFEARELTESADSQTTETAK